jgi:hypothetical protein
MNAQRQPSDQAPVPPAYEPPTVRLLGNVHDLLAMAKSADVCDGPVFAPGDQDASFC